MIQEKVIKNLQLLWVGVAKYLRVSMRCPKSRFPIGIIVFELELIIFVIQGLTLSTASLVFLILSDWFTSDWFQHFKKQFKTIIHE